MEEEHTQLKWNKVIHIESPPMTLFQLPFSGPTAVFFPHSDRLPHYSRQVITILNRLSILLWADRPFQDAPPDTDLRYEFRPCLGTSDPKEVSVGATAHVLLIYSIPVKGWVTTDRVDLEQLFVDAVLGEIVRGDPI